MNSKGLTADLTTALGIEDIQYSILEAVRDNCDPSDVFSKDQLAEWAEDAGYVKVD